MPDSGVALFTSHALLTARAMRRKVTRSARAAPRFVRFAGVALIMAVIDAGGLYALNEGAGINLYLARLCSYAVAMIAGYFLNSRLTFSRYADGRNTLTALLRFCGVHGVGGSINYAIFLLVIQAGHLLDPAQKEVFWLPLLGVVLGGIVGMCFNYTLSRQLVFTDR